MFFYWKVFAIPEWMAQISTICKIESRRVYQVTKARYTDKRTRERICLFFLFKPLYLTLSVIYAWELTRGDNLPPDIAPMKGMDTRGCSRSEFSENGTFIAHKTGPPMIERAVWATKTELEIGIAYEWFSKFCRSGKETSYPVRRTKKIGKRIPHFCCVSSNISLHLKTFTLPENII